MPAFLPLDAPDEGGRTRLMRAAMCADTGEVRNLLRRGADASLRDRNSDTPMALAVMRQHTGVMAVLVASGISVDESHPAGGSILLIAIRGGHYEAVTWLVERGADVNQSGPNGSSPLTTLVESFAEYWSDDELIYYMRLLIQHGAEVGAPGTPPQQRATPLHRAASRGSIAAVRLLVESGADINVGDSRGTTPIGYAARQNHWDVVTLLEANGADISGVLAAALELPNPACLAQVLTLISRGADIDARNELGKTALILAALWGNTSVAKELIARAADVHLVDIYGLSALTWAAQNDHLEIVKMLMAQGVDVNVGREVAHMPLLGTSDPRILRALLDHGADPDAKDRNNHTALMSAVMNRNAEKVRLLLQRGADYTVWDGASNTALSLAKEVGHPKIIRMLEAAGARQ